ECMVFLLMGGAYLRSRIKQAGKWDQETIVSFFLCQYCSGEYLPMIYTFLIQRSRACRVVELSRIRTISAFGQNEAQARSALAGLPLVFLSRTPSKEVAA
ncbi:hypothetical protein ACEUCT_18875, partial [Aeromonas caviae]